MQLQQSWFKIDILWNNFKSHYFFTLNQTFSHPTCGSNGLKHEFKRKVSSYKKNGYKSYIIHICKPDLALNNPYWLMCYETQTTNQQTFPQTILQVVNTMMNI